jgi:hypothetical protein
VLMGLRDSSTQDGVVRQAVTALAL